MAPSTSTMVWLMRGLVRRSRLNFGSHGSATMFLSTLPSTSPDCCACDASKQVMPQCHILLCNSVVVTTYCSRNLRRAGPLSRKQHGRLHVAPFLRTAALQRQSAAAGRHQNCLVR